MRMWSSSASSAIVDLCSGEKSVDAIVSMVMQFCIAIQRSKRKLLKYARIIENREDFNVIDALRDICNHRKFYSAPNFVPGNMRCCLEATRLINIVMNNVLQLKSRPFDNQNPDHLSLLNQFWQNMKPGRPRSDVLVSNEWLELGFQGSDPSTDFRSMGCLALIQLEHFSKHRNEAAILILGLFSNNSRYFPFAIIGVNITRFVLELIDEKRILRLLIENLGHVVAGDLHSYEIMPSDDSICINFGVSIIHDFYCIIFEEFYLQWVIVNPDNVIQFSDIFDVVKASIRKKYPSLSSS
jgi:hypothetical protein